MLCVNTGHAVETIACFVAGAASMSDHGCPKRGGSRSARVHVSDTAATFLSGRCRRLRVCALKCVVCFSEQSPPASAPLAAEPAGSEATQPEKRARLSAAAAPFLEPAVPPATAEPARAGTQPEKPARMDWVAAEPAAAMGSGQAPGLRQAAGAGEGAAGAAGQAGAAANAAQASAEQATVPVPDIPEHPNPSGGADAGAPAGGQASVAEVGRDEEMTAEEDGQIAAAVDTLVAGQAAPALAEGAPAGTLPGAAAREAPQGAVVADGGSPLDLPHPGDTGDTGPGADGDVQNPNPDGVSADLPDDGGGEGGHEAGEVGGEAGGGAQGGQSEGPNPSPANAGGGAESTPAGLPRKAERRKIEWAPAAADAAPTPAPAAAAPAVTPALPTTSIAAAAAPATVRAVPVLPAVRALQAALPPQGGDLTGGPGGAAQPGRGLGAGRGPAARRGRGATGRRGGRAPAAAPPKSP